MGKPSLANLNLYDGQWWMVGSLCIFQHSLGFIVVTYVWRVYECMTPDFFRTELRNSQNRCSRGRSWLARSWRPNSIPISQLDLAWPVHQRSLQKWISCPTSFWRSGRICQVQKRENRGNLTRSSCTIITELVWRTEVTLPSSLRNSNSYTVSTEWLRLSGG